MKALLLLGAFIACLALAVAFAIVVLSLVCAWIEGWRFSARVVDEDELRKAGL